MHQSTPTDRNHLPDHVTLGDPAAIDPSVLLGYPTGRKIADHRLIIGPHARIRSGTLIYEGSIIGSHLSTGHHVVIREESVIGDHFTIWSNAVLDYGCHIGHRVKIHAQCYVAQYTDIEDDVFLAPGVTIANDLHPGCAHSSKCLRGPTIKKGAQIGVSAVLLPAVVIGEGALVGSGAVVTRDVPPFSVAIGNPARVTGSVHDLKCTTGLTDVPYPQR